MFGSHAFGALTLSFVVTVLTACSDDGSDADGSNGAAGSGGASEAGGPQLVAGSGGSGGSRASAGASSVAGSAIGGADGGAPSNGGRAAGGANAGSGGVTGRATGGLAGVNAGGLAGMNASGSAGETQGRGGSPSAGRGGASAGGASGASGSGPTAGTSACPDELVGWAKESGDSVTTTTGGGDATPVRPQNAAELLEYASDAMPRVIEISGVFATPSLQINSNKTLVGVGNATINGGLRIRGRAGAPVSNVIVKNLRVNGSSSNVDGDAIQIHYAHHVWVDHCEVWDGADGNLDIVHGANWVTVSWTKFRYTSAAPDAAHKFSTLIGHSDDNASEDAGRLKVTMHHNFWAEGVTERMPRARFGQVHVFNNYFAAPGNNYCIRAGRQAQILAESNVFQGVKSPHEFNNADDQATANITVRNNLYMNVSGTQATGGGGTPFTAPPYAATIDPANTVAARVQSCVGPR